MNKNFLAINIKRLFLLVFFAFFGGSPILAGTISQAPLFISGADIDPNIMFIIDDSGSMQWEFMPDETMHFSIYVFPVVNNVYGGSVYTNQVPNFDDNNLHNFFSRSSENNKVFYNPDITYKPWHNHDGTPMADANPTCAYYNPASTGLGCMNLKDQNTKYALWFYNTSNQDLSQAWGNWSNHTFWPITYYNYVGGSRTLRSSYTRVQITSSTPSTSTFTSPNGTIRTRDQEIQNFANWYQYYRSRILASRAGIGKAFAAQGESIRVGFGAINKEASSVDNVSTTTIIRGVRPFSGSDREDFFTRLYNHIIPTSGTPLRRALDAAGQYYMRTDSRGPCSTTPGQSGGDDISCRQNYTVLMTDGYWNGSAAATAAARDNVDGQAGSLIINPNPSKSNFQYSPKPPYEDAWSNTLADIAMYYWNRDLRPDLDNNVPTSTSNEAFWQHMVTFGVGLGVAGTLDPENDFAGLVAGTTQWPQPYADAGPANVDDLWHASVNSRGGFFSAADPDVFAERLGETLDSIVSQSMGTAAAIATNSTRLVDGALIYQAKFDSTDWSGELVCYRLDPDTGYVDGTAWTTDDAGRIPSHESRRIFTWNGSAGLQFSESSWDSLSVAQRTALQAGGTVQQGKDRLNWIRGQQSKEEGQAGGYLRKRSKVLGDIVNSDPVVVGVLNFRYENLPAGTPGQDTYAAFVEANKTRRRMVYVGANDGMLHAFDANSGEEVFAYVPGGVYQNLAYLTDPAYTHRYYVDGSPFVGDAYIDGQWRTILIGTLGGGGRSVFALDVTDPDNFNAGNVMWEFADPELGNSFAQPVIGRMANGAWAVIFGNGYGSNLGESRLFILDVKTGGTTLRRVISAGTGPGNGLSTPAMVANSQRTLTTGYAGDLLGNLWKFDLSHASNTGQWNVAFTSGSNRYPLFTARYGSTQVQPITAPLDIGLHPNGNYMIYFGTGKYFEVGDNLVGSNPDVQTFYAIEDTGTRISVLDRSSLVKQDILAEVTFSGLTWRITSHKSDAAFAGKRGWYLDLLTPVNVRKGERVVSVPLLRHGRVIFTTLIPSQDPCSAGGKSWLMELDARTGNRVGYAVFDVNRDGRIDASDVVAWGTDNASNFPSGVQVDGIIKTGAVITAGATEKKYFGKSDGDLFIATEPTDPDGGYGRRSWRQLK
ncbi:PilC/PilY family type IV pilus protein [Desulfuromonas sp. CSMB_57]|uniref:pilus assembly protein n=1 Tax=Desulfuromonas sp. CSMB_57 TaxID=2807629 RepID=UPI0020C1641B|nr:PilC/PilY family type IV pilus protein [Desulfuromonas sp. CSMB_57]